MNAKGLVSFAGMKDFSLKTCVAGHFSMADFLILVETKRSEWIMSSGKCHATF